MDTRRRVEIYTRGRVFSVPHTHTAKHTTPPHTTHNTDTTPHSHTHHHHSHYQQGGGAGPFSVSSLVNSVNDQDCSLFKKFQVCFLFDCYVHVNVHVHVYVHVFVDGQSDTPTPPHLHTLPTHCTPTHCTPTH